MTTEVGLEKAALLLMSMGSDDAAEILRRVSAKNLQQLSQAMTSMKPQPPERVCEIINELEAFVQLGNKIEADEDHVKNMLTKALGDDRASHLISRYISDSNTAGIENLKYLDATTAVDLIRNEHPQIIATILVHLEFDHAGEILKLFPDRLRNDVILRIATLEGVQPTALADLNQSLMLMLNGASSVGKSMMGGIKQTAEILNFVGATLETEILESVREYDPNLAQKIIDEMFSFENLLDIDDRGMQAVLREVSSDILILALKGASPDLREKVFSNMSSRASEMLREDLESKGPVRLSEVEAQQKEIIKVVRRLAEEGTIILGGKGSDDAYL